MKLVDRILHHWGYVRLPQGQPVVVAMVENLDEARRLTEQLKRDMRVVDAELSVLRMKERES